MSVGAVAIGRNEGERLRVCLASMRREGLPVVYVDSGSTDHSLAIAAELGVTVVNLDLSHPFTAARARNEGWRRLLEVAPEVEFIQFVDGDCEIEAGWLPAARAALQADPKLAAVCGRRRERYPERSVYNRLCDIEWDTPIGATAACGGDALMRRRAVEEVGGYDPTVIAAEDNEFCLRLRRAGYTIQRLDVPMTIHDAAIVRVGQWWKRAERSGFAYAQGAAMYGAAPERHFVRERRRILLWGLLLPALLLGLAWPTGGWSLLGFLIYPVQALRIARSTRRRQKTRGDSLAYGVQCLASKTPEMLGLMRYYLRRLRRGPTRIIEYK